MKIPKRVYPADVKTLAVQRVQGGQTVGAGARDLGLVEQTRRNCVKTAAAAKLNGAGAKVVTPDEVEFSPLGAENIRLEWEKEVLKKATAYVAKDALRSAPRSMLSAGPSTSVNCAGCWG